MRRSVELSLRACARRPFPPLMARATAPPLVPARMPMHVSSCSLSTTSRWPSIRHPPECTYTYRPVHCPCVHACRERSAYLRLSVDKAFIKLCICGARGQNTISPCTDVGATGRTDTGCLCPPCAHPFRICGVRTHMQKCTVSRCSLALDCSCGGRSSAPAGFGDPEQLPVPVRHAAQSVPRRAERCHAATPAPGRSPAKQPIGL